MMYFEKKLPGTVLRPAGARARGGRTASGKHLGGSRELCSGSRELWEGCRRLWKGFYEDSKRSCDDFVMIVLLEIAGNQF